MTEKVNPFDQFNFQTFVEHNPQLAKLHDKFMAEIQTDCTDYNEAMCALILTLSQCSSRIIEAYTEKNIQPNFVFLLESATKLNLEVLLAFERAKPKG